MITVAWLRGVYPPIPPTKDKGFGDRSPPVRPSGTALVEVWGRAAETVENC